MHNLEPSWAVRVSKVGSTYASNDGQHRYQLCDMLLGHSQWGAQGRRGMVWSICSIPSHPIIVFVIFHPFPSAPPQLPHPATRGRASAKSHLPTDEPALQALKPLSPVPALVLEYRGLLVRVGGCCCGGGGVGEAAVVWSCR